MAVNINVPSQVKTYANLAAFPATGALKTIYIAEDTNKTYRWTGSVYTEISASAAMTWGAIGGTLSNQTDLQSALDAKVPTSRTLTINGVTQDLSVDRTYTISTGITIGSTAIASGTVGRILFEGTGNVVQESSSLFWDNTNGRLGIGTSTAPSGSVYIDNSGNDVKQHLVLKNSDAGSGAQVHLDLHNNVAGSSYSSGASLFLCSSTHAAPYASALGFWNYLNGPIALATNSAERMRVAASGNVLINTTTDAGFRLDVNGTLRSLGFNLLTSTGNHYANGFQTSSTDGTFNFRRFADNGWVRFTLGANSQFFMSGETGTGELRVGAANGHFLTLYSGGSERIRLFNSTGNVGINTTTDAGFRLDVNGTARFSGGVTGIAGSQTSVSFGVNGLANGMYNPGGNSIGFSTNSAPRIYLDGSNMNLAVPLCVSSSVVTNPNASAQLDVSSTTKGFLPPRMTTTQKNAIASPAAGLMVYDTTLNVISYYNGSMWI